MEELLKAAAQTPLPNILVVAGVAFLFLSVGGRLGAQLATDSIKPRVAGSVGLVMMICGIGLQLSASDTPDSHAPNAQAQLANPGKETTGGAEQNAYVLRTSTVPTGRTVEARTASKLTDGTFRLQLPAGGALVTGSAKIEQNETCTVEVLSSETGRVTVLKSTVLASATVTTLEIGEKSNTTTEHDVLVGLPVLIEYRNGGWHKSLLGAAPDDAQARELRSAYADETETYPQTPVSIGGTWTLSGPQVAAISGLGDMLTVNGSATMQLDRVFTRDGESFAEISVKRLEVDGTSLDENNNILRSRVGGHGSILRSLTRFVDAKTTFEGTATYEGETKINDQFAHMTLAGSFAVEGEEKVVSK
jgi:hypothetical protein